MSSPSKAENDRIRRELGADLIEAERRAGVHHQQQPVKPEPKPQEPEKVVTILDNDEVM